MAFSSGTWWWTTWTSPTWMNLSTWKHDILESAQDEFRSMLQPASFYLEQEQLPQVIMQRWAPLGSSWMKSVDSPSPGGPENPKIPTPPPWPPWVGGPRWPWGRWEVDAPLSGDDGDLWLGDKTIYPLVNVYTLLLKIAIEIVDFSINSMVIFHSGSAALVFLLSRHLSL